jgi:hypothetical protein
MMTTFGRFPEAASAAEARAGSARDTTAASSDGNFIAGSMSLLLDEKT